MHVDTIRQQFEAGQITWREVRELLKDRPKPWASAAWKQRRNEVLKSKCEVCGSADTLVVQHAWHPPTFAQLCELVKPALREEYAIAHPRTLPEIAPFDPASVPRPEMTARQSCPDCQSVSIRHRKKTDDWVCLGRSSNKACGNVFLAPSTQMWSRWSHEDLIEQARTRHHRPQVEAENLWEHQFRFAFHDRICHEATRLWFVVHDRYVALRDDDVSTLCKKCAFKQDLSYIAISGWIGKLVGLTLEGIRRHTPP
jgi:ribosomal protein L37AE/L43A